MRRAPAPRGRRIAPKRTEPGADHRLLRDGRAADLPSAIAAHDDGQGKAAAISALRHHRLTR